MTLTLQTTKPIRSEKGSSLVEMALILPLLLLLLAGIVDLGRAFYYSDALARAAEAGALYGSQNPTDTTGMVQAAENDSLNMNGAAATASYGCECDDGTDKSPDCTIAPACTTGTNEVYYSTVTATATYKTLIHWPGIPSSYNLSSTAVMRSGN